MIDRPTVLVLGAGASRPYGFPTGPDMVAKIVTETKNTKSHTAGYLLDRGIREHQIRAFGEALEQSHLPSVDAFLETWPDFVLLGKIAIACALIPCEDDNQLNRAHGNGRWYAELWRLLGQNPSRFSENKLSS